MSSQDASTDVSSTPDLPLQIAPLDVKKYISEIRKDDPERAKLIERELYIEAYEQKTRIKRQSYIVMVYSSIAVCAKKQKYMHYKELFKFTKRNLSHKFPDDKHIPPYVLRHMNKQDAQVYRYRFNSILESLVRLGLIQYDQKLIAFKDDKADDIEFIAIQEQEKLDTLKKGKVEVE